MQKYKNNVYVETGFRGCNCSFVVTSEGLVMIDTPMVATEAIKWRDEMAKFGEVRYLINGEPHSDHISGNCFFGGTVVGQEGTRQVILEAKVDEYKMTLEKLAPDSKDILKDFHFRPSTITFSQRLTLYSGNHTFILTHMPGHSPSQTAVYCPEERTVFTSDNVTGGMPFFITALPYQWLESLAELEKLDFDVLVPGHGPVCDKSFLPKMKANLMAWIDPVSSAIKKGMSQQETVDSVSRLSLGPSPTMASAMGQGMQRENIANLYKALMKK